MRTAIISVRKRFMGLIQQKMYSNKSSKNAYMNELPVPCGPWDPWYKAKQSFYTKHLVAGIVWWLLSLGLALYTESIYLNFSPPAQPGPPSDMVEECDDSDS
ncbi:uncharacterized protein LOC119840617 [Zerene cesonia]|uniref:uncharacterized protein LOC119840617 n=1 Tax=Zerene cesonia TaxID=33412 RepID=UPI0018E4FF1B|nr:uncharacterized protein LOC119840617 [Zerene cesonia]